MIRVTQVVLLASSLIAVQACNKGSSKSDDDVADSKSEKNDEEGANDPSNEPQEGQIMVTGTLALGLSLTQGDNVTHVIASNTDTNESHVASVGADGSFSLPVEAGENWVLTYIDSTKTGADMLVSTFSAGALDTLPPAVGSGNVELGTVDATGEKATSTLAESDLLTSIGMSTEAAATYGAIDDVSLRYSNPDIDADGKVDAENGQKFLLDFHNRFSFKKPGGGDYAMKDIKNAFPAADALLEFTGSGIIPWFEDSAFSEPVTDYKWSFSSDAQLNSTCAGIAGDALAAGTECELSLNGAQSVPGKPSIELKAAVDGTYTLVAGGKTFTWTNVKVSDFSGAEGFVALYVKMDVSDADKLTGISYKWQRKTAEGWELATPEVLKLIVAGKGGYASLKVGGMNSGKELGITIPLESEGSIVFANAKYHVAGTGEAPEDALVMLPEGVTEAAVKAGLDWQSVLENPGISYDDKLGMRFFFGFNGSNN